MGKTNYPHSKCNFACCSLLIKMPSVVNDKNFFSDISTNLMITLISYLKHLTTFMLSLDSYWLKRFRECIM